MSRPPEAFSWANHPEARCPKCGVGPVLRQSGLCPREAVVAIVLALCFLVPGIVYFTRTQRIPRCRHCGKRIR